jgi:hypothetical protein
VLKIRVKDFGPIIEGEVELKPLTIFVGPSNSGKSYFATLIYSLLQLRPHLFSYRGHSIELPIWDRRRRFGLTIDPTAEAAFGTPEVGNALVKWARDPRRTLRDEAPFVGLPSEVQAAIKDILTGFMLELGGQLNRDLQRCFGDVSDLVRRASSHTELHMEVDQDQAPLHLQFRASNGTVVTDQVSLDLSGMTVAVPVELRMLRSRQSPSQLYMEGLVLDFMFASFAALYESFPVESYYLPAARSGIAQGHKAIASILVRQSSFAAIEPLEIPTLSGIITDFISRILALETRERYRAPSGLKDVVAFLERQVLQGTIDLDQGAKLAYPEIYYQPFTGQPKIGKFPFHRTSSMVSELAPVILFLKYLVGPKDLLILEEPESHLHPAIQRQMARGIARLVNSGVKVLITTHSDYFVAQINNLMRLSLASPAKLRKEKYSAADCLKADDVAAYQFVIDDEKEGSFVKRLPVTAEEGIPEVEFQGVAEALYEEVLSLQRVRGK